MLWSKRSDTTAHRAPTTDRGRLSGDPMAAELDSDEVANRKLAARHDMPDASAQRQSVAPRIQITSKRQEPIEGVRAMSIALDLDRLQSLGAWPNLDWDALDVSSKLSISDAQGIVEAETLTHESGPNLSVIWFTHPDYVASAIRIDSSAATAPSLVVMEPGGRVSARVIAADSSPVPEARIIELTDETRVDPDAAYDEEQLARRVLHRTFKTDSTGTAVLEPFPGKQWIVAELGNRRSEPWIGAAPASITLELRSTFTAQGQVLPEQGVHVEHGWNVTVSARRGQELALLTRGTVRSDGYWGPVRIPIVPADEFVFHLQAGTMAQDEVVVAQPNVDTSITVDFHPHPGFRIAVHLVDEEHHDLPGGTVGVNWNQDGKWQRIERTTGKDGIARFRNCEPGQIWIRVRCPGFIARLLSPFDAGAPPSDPLLVTLSRAGKIEGRCVHATAPVANFEILFWQGNPNTLNKKLVRDSRDGSFVIDESPIGDVDVLATSNEYPHCPPVRLKVVSDVTSKVEFDFPSPLIGRGRVVDALTGEPLPRATVQVFSLYKNLKVRPWRLAQPVDSKGAFEIAGFLIGDNTMDVAAPGYATRQVNAFGIADQRIEFDIIGMFSKQSIAVELASNDPVDFTHYKVGLEGPMYFASKVFPSSGRFTFTGIDPGHYGVRVIAPDGTLLFDSFVVDPGKDVHVLVPLSARHLDVEVVPDSGGAIPTGALLRATFKSADQHSIEQYYDVPSDGHVRVARVEGAEVTLHVEDASEAVLAVQSYALGPTGPSAVKISLSSSERKFRVVDKNKKPVAGARLTLTRPGDPSGWLLYLLTNDTGDASIKGLSFPTVFINVFENAFGVQPSALVDVSRDTREPIELTLAPSLTLRVRALERSQPAPNLELRACDQQGLVFGLNSGTTNADGIASWGPVGKGEFKIEVRHPGYWPSDHLLRLDEDAAPLAIQVRRLGNVELTVSDVHENPVSGVAVDLYSIEDQQWVSSWIGSGAVHAPEGGLKTNSAGKVRVNAVPNGLYRWRVTPAETAMSEGEFTIAPQSTSQVAVEVH